MERTIKEMDQFCRLHNLSIKFNRKRQHCGYKVGDYAVKVMHNAS